VVALLTSRGSEEIKGVLERLIHPECSKTQLREPIEAVETAGMTGTLQLVIIPIAIARRHGEPLTRS
jgi:hypothetical protein